MPKEHRAQSGAASPHPAAEMSAEAMSPTEALATANLSAPLTPPNDTNDQLIVSILKPDQKHAKG